MKKSFLQQLLQKPSNFILITLLLCMGMHAQTKKQPKKYEPISLFNLANDPGESRNLAITEPERVAEMRKELSVLLKGAVAPGGK